MVNTISYIPRRGDVIWLNFTPQAGREQAGKRPALVISPLSYNQKVGLVLCCPITSQVKGYPFEVKLPEGLKVNGVILADHIKNLDWRVRQAEFICDLPEPVVKSVIKKLKTLLD